MRMVTNSQHEQAINSVLALLSEWRDENGQTDLDEFLRLHSVPDDVAEEVRKHELRHANLQQIFERSANDPAESFEVIGQYKVISKIGEGGMGSVFLARHPKLGRNVAIKLLRSTSVKANSKSRFDLEVMALGKLHHPNLVFAFDAGEVNDIPFVVMEYIPGIDVSRALKLAGQFNTADACEIARQAALAVEHAHANNLMHRDIKPSNLMLDKDGIVKLLDLGLAKFTWAQQSVDKLTATGNVMGTIDYMSPEQAIDSSSVNSLSDIYSLGATLYCLIAGHPPYPDKEYATAANKLLAIASKPVPPLTKVCPNVPRELSHIVSRMMAKEPEDRIGSAEEVASILNPFCEQHNLQLLVKDEMQFETSGHSTSPLGLATLDTVSDFVDKSHPSRRTIANNKKKIWIAIMATVLLAAISATAFVLTRSDHGDLVIRYDGSDEITVTIRRADESTKQFKVKGGADNVFEIASGEFRLEVEGASPDELIFEADTFELRRGGKTIVSVTRRNSSDLAQANKDVESSADIEFANWIITQRLWEQNERNAPAAGSSFSPRIVAYYETEGFSNQQITPDKQPFPEDMRIFSVEFNHPKPDDLRRISKLKSIRHLFVDMYPAKGWDTLSAENLTALSYGGPDINSQSFIDFVARADNLKSLAIGSVGSGHIAPLSKRSFEAILDVSPNLTRLDLSNIPVQDEWLSEIADLEDLEELFLARTSITDDGLKHVAKLANLRWLILDETRVSDDGMIELADCRMLSNIYLNNVLIKGPGLVKLQGLPSLELRLGSEQLSEDLPVHLQELKNLVSLTIGNGKQFEDRHVDAFGELNWLQLFSLADCSFSEQGVNELEQKLKSIPPSTRTVISRLNR